MTKRELLRLLVLVEIADDCEEPSHVWENVARRAATCGIPATKQAIELFLLEFVEQGLAKAYDIRVDHIVELAGAPELGRIDKCCFWITETGLAALLAAREEGPWPFDDEGDLVGGWRPPKE